MSSLAPGLLIAAPPLGDPNFDRSVVLLAAHGDEGAFGWVINGNRVMSLSELLVHAEVAKVAPKVPGVVRVGGPVSPQQVWLLYPEEERFDSIEEQWELGAGLLACASRRALEKIAEEGRAHRVLGLVGYAGWAPGQLEGEIRAGAWLPCEARADLVFDVDQERMWEEAYATVGATPLSFTTRVVGSA